MRSLFFWVFLILYEPVCYGGSNKCNLADSATENLARLLKWCDQHKISDDKCTELLDFSSGLSITDFQKKLIKLESEFEVSISSRNKSPSSKLSDNIPKKASKALEELQLLSSSSDNIFFKTINFKKTAQKYFDTLSHAEIKNLYEIVDKFKNSGNQSDLIKSLKNKGIEKLSLNPNNKSCTGENILAVRLSQGARMCFHIDGGTIDILCIGFGRICYDH
jgi:hypothetical protein